MDELTRQYIISSIKGVFDRWFWPPELFIDVFRVIPSCRLADQLKYNEVTGSPDNTLINKLIEEEK